MAPSLRQIEVFHTVMVTGSATKAAEALGTSQPLVSRTISELEAELGLVLFDRGGRRLSPTPEAQVLQEEIERVYLGLQHISDVARRVKSDGAAQVRVATIPSLVSFVIEDIVAPFYKNNPGIRVSLEVQSSYRALEQVVTQQSDVGISVTPVLDPEFEVRKIGEITACCVVAQDHRLARGRRPIDIRALAGETFVSYLPGGEFRRSLDKLFETHGIERTMGFEARSTDALLQMVAAVDGVSIIPTCRISSIDHYGLVARPIHPEILTDVVAIRHSSRPLTVTARRFLKHLDEAGMYSVEDGVQTRRGGRRVRSQ